MTSLAVTYTAAASGKNIVLPPNGDLSVFRGPLRAGAAHVVRLGPISIGRFGHCGLPGIRSSRARPRGHDDDDVCYCR
jgi:hypothetical protein